MTLLRRRKISVCFLLAALVSLTYSPGWISRNITYGLYLSDRTVLNDIETELVVLSGIMIQNLPRETRWHIRGSRRIGIEKADLEAVCECVSSHSSSRSFHVISFWLTRI